MNIHMYHVICVGVKNQCFHVPCLIAVLSWILWNKCPNVVTHSTCQNWSWSWASALTLLNTIAQKHFPYLYTISYLILSSSWSSPLSSFLHHPIYYYCPYVPPTTQSQPLLLPPGWLTHHLLQTAWILPAQHLKCESMRTQYLTLQCYQQIKDNQH